MDIQIEAHEGLRCGCGEEPLLQADMPDPGARAGRSLRTLCSHCDAGSAAGRPLLSWFGLHPVVAEDDVEEFCALLRRWLEDVGPPGIDSAELDQVVEAWRAALA